ncbi:MAG: DUF86 domain-containing protein [Calditrichaeota bacterium]|nr:MAG: DUF86 domain-containing protein [Calditrichota bacterium]
MSVDAIKKKMAKILEYVSILQSMEKDCLKRMQADKVFRGSVLYYLYMMADSCVALAEMIIKQKGLPKPQSYAEAIDILGQQQILPDAFAYEFARIAGFRNFLAHDYEKIDYEEICQILMSKVDEVKKYISYIQDAL